MTALSILHLEDSQHDADLVEATLAAGGIEATITRVDRREAFEAALGSGRFDAILADYHLPQFDGLSAQVIAARFCPDIPFIFLSGSIGEELAVERLKEGATDYVLKDRMARLPSAVRRALAEAAERAERRRAEEDVRRLNAELEQRVVERTRALAESERRLRAILDHSPAMISLKDTNGKYIVTNREFERAAGLPGEAIAGRADEDLFPPRLADVYHANDEEVLRRNEFVEREETFLLPNGARVCHSIKFPLLDESGAAYALGAIAIDITERKKTDDALKIARLEAERANRAKSEFLSRMSHDLRTPLNAILGFAQLLDAAGLGEDGQESVDQILRGGKHLLELINEVLDIARIEAEQIVELVRPLASRRGIVTEVVIPESGDVVVAADRQRLNQILMNLVSNALKYNRPNGRVTIAFVPVAADRVRIAVTDTGAGIPPAKLSLLFQPFERLGAEQTDVEGTGLGLALARGLAEAMGGSLGVESRVDAGTTFWIELALCEAAETRQVAAVQVAPDTSGETAGLVLYIEDNSSNVRLMQRVLQRRPGVRLLHAPGGTSGLEHARQARPDLIFLDMHLPDMSGEDVLLQLWQDAALRHIPVAILSADATPAQTRRLKAAGAIAYLTKPLEISAVLTLLDDRLRRATRVHEHADLK